MARGAMIIHGVILAGGLARRMGGGDKALRQIAGRPLLDRVIERLRPQVAAMALNANGDPARFAAYALPVIADTRPGHPGPLAGVLAGMEWAAAGGATHILTAAADTPFFPADLGAKLGEAVAAGAPLAIAATPDAERGLARHPTFGLWPVALRGELSAALEAGLRKVVLWTEQNGAANVRFPAEPYDPFVNVNTPDDVTLAEAIAAEHGI